MAGSLGSLASAIISGRATILAPMLTLLSLSRKLERDLGPAFYRRVARIALVALAPRWRGCSSASS